MDVLGRFLERAERRKSKAPIEAPPDFGFHLPFAYLERVCPYVIASGYSIFPHAGGLDDQDPLFLDDLETYTWLQEWAEQEVNVASEEFREEGAKARKLAFDEL